MGSKHSAEKVIHSALSELGIVRQVKAGLVGMVWYGIARHNVSTMSAKNEALRRSDVKCDSN